MRKVVFKKIVVVITSLFILTGCSNMSSGISVGDQSLKSSEIQRAVDEILEARKTLADPQMQLVDTQKLLRNQAQFAVITILFNEIAKELNISVTPSDVNQRRIEVVAQIGGEDRVLTALVNSNLAESSFDDYLRLLIIIDILNNSLIANGASEEQASLEVSKLLVVTA
jgi:FKBP-type peptidyl-prolyl cis-trans isomerase (trigger factor)